MTNGIAYYTDGSSKSNPGPAGAGVFQQAYNNIPPIFKSRFLGETTNNIAELMALHDATICARAVIPQLQPDARVYFFIDNTIAIKTGMGYVKCRSHPGIAKVIVDNIRLISSDAHLDSRACQHNWK